RRPLWRGVPGRQLGGGGGGRVEGVRGGGGGRVEGARSGGGGVRVNRLVVAVVGPTATGKSDLALALAHRLDGEVVNADSMQLYRGMDIGTAKLPPAQRQGVP